MSDTCFATSREVLALASGETLAIFFTAMTAGAPPTLSRAITFLMVALTLCASADRVASAEFRGMAQALHESAKSVTSRRSTGIKSIPRGGGSDGDQTTDLSMVSRFFPWARVIWTVVAVPDPSRGPFVRLRVRRLLLVGGHGRLGPG